MSTPIAARRRALTARTRQGEVDEAEQALDRLLGRHPPAEADGEDAVALDHAPELPSHDPGEGDDPGDLPPPGRGPGAAPHEHEADQDHLGEGDPRLEVLAGEAGRRLDARRLDSGRAERVLARAALVEEQGERHEGRRAPEHHEVGPDLEVAEEAPHLPLDEEPVVLDEAHSREQNERRHDPLDGGAPEAPDDRGPRREADHPHHALGEVALGVDHEVDADAGVLDDPPPVVDLVGADARR